MTNDKVSKHTPGPWLVEMMDRETVRVRGPDAEHVAIVPADDTEERHGRIYEFVSRTGRANAALIAAAPEMLAALKATRELVEMACAHVSFAPGGENWAERRLEMMEAAITKAEGSS